MPLGTLQHFTIEPSDLERTKDFYCDVLGLENGERPPLDFPGYWLYSGGVATVHLMGTRKPREGIVVRGTEKKYDDTGRLDHIAFAATDVEGVRKRLQSKNVKFRESIVPRTGDTQIFLYDPDGVGVELNFSKAYFPGLGFAGGHCRPGQATGRGRSLMHSPTTPPARHKSGMKRSAFPQLWVRKRTAAPPRQDSRAPRPSPTPGKDARLFAAAASANAG